MRITELLILLDEEAHMDAWVDVWTRAVREVTGRSGTYAVLCMVAVSQLTEAHWSGKGKLCG